MHNAQKDGGIMRFSYHEPKNMYDLNRCPSKLLVEIKRINEFMQRIQSVTNQDNGQRIEFISQKEQDALIESLWNVSMMVRHIMQQGSQSLLSIPDQTYQDFLKHTTRILPLLRQYSVQYTFSGLHYNLFVFLQQHEVFLQQHEQTVAASSAPVVVNGHPNFWLDDGLDWSKENLDEIKKRAEEKRQATQVSLTQPAAAPTGVLLKLPSFWTIPAAQSGAPEEPATNGSASPTMTTPPL